jgi:hypothetical protein
MASKKGEETREKERRIKRLVSLRHSKNLQNTHAASFISTPLSMHALASLELPSLSSLGCQVLINVSFASEILFESLEFTND